MVVVSAGWETSCRSDCLSLQRMPSVAAASKLPDCVWIVPEDSTRIFVSQQISVTRYRVTCKVWGMEVEAYYEGPVTI